MQEARHKSLHIAIPLYEMYRTGKSTESKKIIGYQVLGEGESGGDENGVWLVLEVIKIACYYIVVVNAHPCDYWKYNILQIYKRMKFMTGEFHLSKKCY